MASPSFSVISFTFYYDKKIREEMFRESVFPSFAGRFFQFFVDDDREKSRCHLVIETRSYNAYRCISLYVTGSGRIGTSR